MAAPFISPEKRQQILDWWRSQKTPTLMGAVRAVGSNFYSIKKTLDDAGVNYITKTISAEQRENRDRVDRAMQLLRPQWEEAYKYVRRERVFTPPRFPWKEIFADDAHGTFWNPYLTRRVVEAEGGEHTGFTTFEAVTLDTWSRFRKTYRANTKQELKAAAEFFDMTSEAFTICRIGTSNHGKRFTDFIATKTDNPQALDDAVDMWTVYFNTLTRLDGKYEFVASSGIQIADVLWAHYRAYMASGQSTVQRVKDHCEAQTQLGFRPPFHIVGMGHTHRVSDTPAKGAPCRLWEVGTQCHVPEYAADPERAMICTTTPIENGYGRVVWDENGNIDPAESRVVRLGTATLPDWSVNQED